MYKTNESEHEYRFGDYGPKYLTNGTSNVDLGVVVINPGESHPCHKHVYQEESFLALDGECEVWMDGKLVLLRAGDYLVCAPGEAHYFRNTSGDIFKSVFVKAPRLVEKDSVYIEWTPGMEFLK